MIKADDVEYEPIFYTLNCGELTNPQRQKRKWYVRVGGYYAIGKTKKAAYTKKLRNYMMKGL